MFSVKIESEDTTCETPLKHDFYTDDVFVIHPRYESEEDEEMEVMEENEENLKIKLYDYLKYGLDFLEQSIEISFDLKMKQIFEYISFDSILFYYENDTSQMKCILDHYMVITNLGVYRIYVKSNRKPKLCPVYTFSSELDVKSLAILKEIKYKYSASMIYRNMIHGTPTLTQVSLEKEFRMIPGSYQNGTWQQLNGFFGSYYNENTHKISMTPPSIKKL